METLTCIAKITGIVFIIVGLGINLTDFFIQMIAFLGRKKAGSPVMMVGFILQVWGLHCFFVLSNLKNVLTWMPWKNFFIFSGLALLLHLFINIALPLIFTMICNLFYGRKLLDMTTLPKKNSAN